MSSSEDAPGGDDEEQTANSLPNWLRATIEDVLAVDVDAALFGTRVADYHTLTNAYSEASRAKEADAAARNIFSFIGAVLGMYLKDDAPNEPFGPMMVFEGKRSPAMSDFAAKAELLAAIADRSAHPLVRARCADLAWLLERRRLKCAQIAVDAYVTAVQDIGSGELEFAHFTERREQHPDVKKLITRALQVARGARKQKVRTEELHTVTKRLFDKTIEAGWVVGALWYGRLVLGSDLLPSKDIAARLEQFLRKPDLQTWVSPTVETWNLVAQCYRLAGIEADERRCLTEAAETLVKHALDQGHSAMVRASFLSDAIVQLQGVPSTRERRNEIKLLLREAQTGIDDEMSAFSQEIDLTDLIEPTIQAFEKMNLIDQLFGFALLDTSPDVDASREEALKQISRYPLGSLFATTILDREGKVVEKAPSHTQGVPSEGAVTHAIARNQNLRRHLVVAGRIEPARQVMNLSAHFSADLLLCVIRSSPFVPPQLQRTYAYGFSRFIQGGFHRCYIRADTAA